MSQSLPRECSGKYNYYIHCRKAYGNHISKQVKVALVLHNRFQQQKQEELG